MARAGVGDPTTVTLYLTTADGLPLSRSKFNPGVWKRAIRAAGIPADRHNGMHVLRHTYASVLLDAGESVKALSTYLGHADPGFTLRTYTHLLPTREDRTRRAIDTAFGGDQAANDGPEAADGMSHGSAAFRATSGAGQRNCAGYLALK
ncbi:tyrosine-type recombinase/integrase [Micromonospora sp. NPDC005215]|uniref:tyrosine-type recombinase/integrase n=1 Tax=Micromonospora sp. NPDC005215 TaxID=3157024 RepID=UPI0033BF4F4C